MKDIGKVLEKGDSAQFPKGKSHLRKIEVSRFHLPTQNQKIKHFLQIICLYLVVSNKVTNIYKVYLH